MLDTLQQNLERYPDRAARVFHGRGKAFTGLDHLNVEWYPPYLIVQNFADTLSEEIRAELLHLFSQQPRIQAILHQFRSWPDTVTEVLISRDDTLTLPITHRVALAPDIQVEVSLGKNRNTGVFLDMRAGWDWVRAHAAEAKVLNLFSYTSVFSLFALRGGARSVDNVDMAANVHKIAERNHQLNDLHTLATFVKRDVLTSARWFEHLAPYDLIILDPPPYQKGAFHGWPDYARLLQQCRSWLAEHGQLLVCLNHPPTSLDQLLDDLRQLFPDAQRFERTASAPEIRELNVDQGLKTVMIEF